MKKVTISLSLAVLAVLAVGVVHANAEDAANLIWLRQDLTLTQSVLNQGTGGSIPTAWDRFQTMPEDLPDVGPGRDTTLNVWQDSGSEYNWIVFSQAANNSVQDAFGGGFLTPLGGSGVLGVSVGWYNNEHKDNFVSTDPSSFSGNSQEISADSYDLRVSYAWKLNDHMNLGFALNSISQEADSMQDFNSTGGGSDDTIKTENDGLNLTAGFKHYLGDDSSYNVRLYLGQDTAKGWEVQRSLDSMGVATDQDWYLLDLDSDTYGVAAQYNRRMERNREWNATVHYHKSDYNLKNDNIFYNIDSMGMLTSFEDAIGDDITDETIGLWFNFVKAWEETEWYCGVGWDSSELDSQIVSMDPFSMFTFDDNFDDQFDVINMWVGFRHHFNDRFALFGSASFAQYSEEVTYYFVQNDDMGMLDFSEREKLNWDEGDTAFHLGVEYVAKNFTLDALYEPETSSSSSPLRGISYSPNLPGSGRNSVASDRVTFAATFHW